MGKWTLRSLSLELLDQGEGGFAEARYVHPEQGSIGMSIDLPNDLDRLTVSELKTLMENKLDSLLKDR